MPSYAVIGAFKGLGYEWLRQLHQDPSNKVIGIVRTPPPVHAKLTTDNVSGVHIIQGDMADHVSLAAAASETSKITSSLDYLIINGAYSDITLSMTTPTAFTGQEEILRKDMTASLEVNVLGVIFSINAFLPLLRKGSVKKIIVISTGMGDLEANLTSGNTAFVTYTCMKAALNMVVVKFSQELKEEGFLVLALSPGIVNTTTAEEIEQIMVMISRYKTFYPGWNGPLMPAESIEAMRKVIYEKGTEDTGAFLSHWGNKMWL